VTATLFLMVGLPGSGKTTGQGSRAAARGPSAKWPASRVFGGISGRSWGVLQHKHLDYHLRQFGV